MSVNNSKEIEKFEETLTPKEALFLKHYMSGMNETDAFIHAQPDATSTRASAGAQGCKLLKKIKKLTPPT